MSRWRLEVWESLGSTSDVCAERAAAGEPDGLAVLALTQTRARGSRGREWLSPRGNLALSVLLRGAGPLAEIGWLPLMAGVALFDALSPLAPDPGRLRLKWPNDLNLDGAKLAGILIEATAAGPDAEAVVIGFGVNLAVAPDVASRATAALAQAAEPPAPEAFARVLLDRLREWREQPRAAIRAAWLGHAHPLGSPLSVSLDGVMTEGLFAGLDEGGRLLLDTPTGVRTIAAGDVVQLRPA